MERVTFLIAETGDQFSCLLNPDRLVVRRTAGLRSRRVAESALVGASASDDALLFTGGGRTVLEFELLFDVDVSSESTPLPEDVRTLTRPFWDLAEGSEGDFMANGAPSAPIVRFIWGKSWNVPGVITAVAERFERFSTAGAPRRSWMRLRMVRVAETETSAEGETPFDEPELREEGLLDSLVGGDSEPFSELEEVEDSVVTHASDRLEQIAEQSLGRASLWRALARFNGVLDPFRLTAGSEIQIPTAAALRRMFEEDPR